jgi:hypothetical protein
MRDIQSALDDRGTRAPSRRWRERLPALRRPEAVASEAVALFVRSSSCVAGRNGRLSLYHHGQGPLSAVRLHYWTMDPAAATQTIELAARAELSFAIPAREITGNWDLQYYFEFLDAAGDG